MGRLLEIVTSLHKATKRDYLARMNDDKVHCMLKAREYEFDYWDGDRRYGYGGYKFIDGRWRPVARALIDIYGLKNGSSVLDVGCGKAFLLYEMKKILPELKVAGFDISKHGLADAREEIKPYLFRYRAQDRYPYGDGTFDLVISLGCLHNLRLFEPKPRCRRSSGSARTSTSWSKVIETSLNSLIWSAGRPRRSPFCIRRNGFGSTISSVIPATTSLSISNRQHAMQVKTAKAAILAQSREPLVSTRSFFRKRSESAKFWAKCSTPRSVERKSTKSRHK
jgi:SAM-dependent methyltransferase